MSSNTLNRELGLQALTKIDETSLKLQNQGCDREACDCLLLGLVKRREIFGAKSEELVLACREVGDAFNCIALKYINASNFSVALEFLKQAQKLVQNDFHGRKVTYQNFAALYQKKGEPRIALRYLKQLLAIQTECCDDADKRANSHLNICASLSQLGKHESALRHAQVAIRIIENQIRGSADTEEGSEDENHTQLNTNGTMVMHSIDEDEDESEVHSIEEPDFSGANARFVEALAIAYYNEGVEYEHLGDIHRSYHSYRQGSEMASSLGCHHAISKAFKTSSQAVHQLIVNNGIGRKM